jgi:hypothetical protein
MVDAKKQSEKIFNELQREEIIKGIKSKKNLSIYKDYFRIKFDENLIEPNPVISFNNISLGSVGDFTLITGKPKSKKTFLLSLIASSMYNDSLSEAIRGQFPEGKNKIAYFDTEQSKYDVQKVANRIKALSAAPVENSLFIYSLREWNHETKKKIIEDFVNDDDTIGLVIIDGIRDLLSDINDPKQATLISEWLLELTAKNNIHLITVLHQNKGDNNSRGHIGTELNNKASSVISVTLDPKNNSVSIVSPEFMRGQSFEPFAFQINEDGLPKVLKEHEVPIEYSKKRNPIDIDDEIYLKVINRTFDGKSFLKYGELIMEFKSNFNKVELKFGDTYIKKLITFFSERNWIVNDNSKWRAVNPIL